MLVVCQLQCQSQSVPRSRRLYRNHSQDCLSQANFKGCKTQENKTRGDGVVLIHVHDGTVEREQQNKAAEDTIVSEDFLQFLFYIQRVYFCK